MTECGLKDLCDVPARLMWGQGKHSLSTALGRAPKIQRGESLSPGSRVGLKEYVETQTELHTEWLKHGGGEPLCAVQAWRVLGDGRGPRQFFTGCRVGSSALKNNWGVTGSREEMAKPGQGLGKGLEAEKENGCWGRGRQRWLTSDAAWRYRREERQVGATLEDL